MDSNGELGAKTKDDDPDVDFSDLFPAAGDEEIPPQIEDDSDSVGGDDNDDTPPPSLRRSKILKRRIPTILYDDVYDLAINLMCPKTVKEALGGDQTEKWAATTDNEQGSLWNYGVCVFGEGDARVLLALYMDDLLVVWKQREGGALNLRRRELPWRITWSVERWSFHL